MGRDGKVRRITALADDSGAERPGLMAAIPPILLLDRVRNRIRLKHYNIRTEQAYCDWIRRFITFRGKRHPSGLDAEEVESFLTSLAVERRVASSTRTKPRVRYSFSTRRCWATNCRGSTASRKRSRRFGCQSCSAEGSRAGACQTSRRAPADRCVTLRHGSAHHGGDAPAREGRRVLAPAVCEVRSTQSDRYRGRASWNRKCRFIAAHSLSRRLNTTVSRRLPSGGIM